MARIRSLHPGWFTDEAWVSVSAHARLLGIGIWTESDDCGAFEWKPLTLKMRLFPADGVDIGALLAELETADLIRRYEHGGRQFGAVRNFMRFQRPKKPKSVHFMPVEFRTYVGQNAGGSEPEHNEPEAVTEKSELEARQRTPVPPKPEIAPQMEDGGWRMEDEKVKTGGGISLDRARPAPTPPVAAAADLILAFDEAYEDTIGQPRRGTSRDQDTADEWAEAGYSADLVRTVASEQIAQMCRAGKRPPSHMGIITTDLASAHAAQVKRDEPREPDDVVQWRARVSGFRAKRFWSAMWGEPPSDPRCAAPVSILTEFGFRQPQTKEDA
jgi:hypothetical protein